LKIPLNIILPSTSGSPQWSLSISKLYIQNCSRLTTFRSEKADHRHWPCSDKFTTWYGIFKLRCNVRTVLPKCLSVCLESQTRSYRWITSIKAP
jgi:hypothetical protein